MFTTKMNTVKISPNADIIDIEIIKAGATVLSSTVTTGPSRGGAEEKKEKQFLIIKVTFIYIC